MITTKVKINLNNLTAPTIIPAVQGDTGRSIIFTLADFTIPSGADAYYYVQKPSGEAVYNTATIADNTITVDLTAQSIAEVGDNYLQVRVESDGEVVTSFDCILLVKPFRGIDAIESTSESNIFDQTAAAALVQFELDAAEKAAETIESIPSDYTTLSNTVTDLKNDLDDTQEQVTNINGHVFARLEQGSVNTNTGAVSDNSSYIRTTLATIKPQTDYKLIAKNTGSARLSFVIVYYKSDQTFLSSQTVAWVNVGNNTVTFTTPENAYYCRMRFSYYPTATLTPAVLDIDIVSNTSEISSLDARLVTLRNNVPFSYSTITETGLDLNGGDFIHPGTWALNDPTYQPYHCPTNKRCRIISFASASDNTIYTYQIVIDADNIKYTRFSTNTSVWSPWVCDNPYNKLSYKPTRPISSFEPSKHTSADTSNYTMIWGSWENRVSRLIAMYDAETNPNDYSITKTSLGKDATNTFDVWLYKVSLGYTNQSNKPAVLLVVGEHGNEPASAMTGYYAYKEILDGSLSKYLTYVDFWVVPLMNPYGYEHNIRNNENDVNLNRDFPANWVYRRDGHNDTGNYSMSQPETNYIINLCLENKNRLLFVCNKHDTGAIGRKIGQNEVDTVGYLTTCLYTDSVINESICKYADQQVKETDPYIVTACTADISHKQLIVNNSPHPLDGSLDLFLNSIGIHASLLEGSYGWNDGETYVYYDADTYNNPNYATSQIRYITDFLVNYLGWTIDNSVYLHSSDRAYADYPLKSRKYDEGTSEWVDIELWYNGTTFVEVT